MAHMGLKYKKVALNEQYNIPQCRHPFNDLVTQWYSLLSSSISGIDCDICLAEWKPIKHDTILFVSPHFYYNNTMFTKFSNKPRLLLFRVLMFVLPTILSSVIVACCVWRTHGHLSVIRLLPNCPLLLTGHQLIKSFLLSS